MDSLETKEGERVDMVRRVERVRPAAGPPSLLGETDVCGSANRGTDRRGAPAPPAADEEVGLVWPLPDPSPLRAEWGRESPGLGGDSLPAAGPGGIKHERKFMLFHRRC